MRAFVLPALLLLAAMPAGAQLMPAPTYLFNEVVGPTEAQLPGSLVQYNFTAERACAFQGDVLPATTAEITFMSAGNLTIAGPGQVEFPEQMCAQQSRMFIAFQATVAVPEGAEAAVHKITAALRAQDSGPMPRYSDEATVDFLVNVKPAKQEALPLAQDKASPGAASVFVMASLALAALAARRHA